MNTPKFALKKYSEEMSSLEKAKNEKKIKSENETEEKRRERERRRRQLYCLRTEQATKQTGNTDERIERIDEKSLSASQVENERRKEKKNKKKKEESKAKRVGSDSAFQALFYPEQKIHSLPLDLRGP